MKINQDNFLKVWRYCRIKKIKRPSYFNADGDMDYMLGKKLVDIVVEIKSNNERSFEAKYKDNIYWSVCYKDLIYEAINYDSLTEIEE